MESPDHLLNVPWWCGSSLVLHLLPIKLTWHHMTMAGSNGREFGTVLGRTPAGKSSRACSFLGGGHHTSVPALIGHQHVCMRSWPSLIYITKACSRAWTTFNLPFSFDFLPQVTGNNYSFKILHHLCTLEPLYLQWFHLARTSSDFIWLINN